MAGTPAAGRGVGVCQDVFVSEEAHSLWKKHYAGKGFIGERGFS